MSVNVVVGVDWTFVTQRRGRETCRALFGRLAEGENVRRDRLLVASVGGRYDRQSPIVRLLDVARIQGSPARNDLSDERRLRLLKG